MRSRFRSLVGCALLVVATLPIAVNANAATDWNKAAADILFTPLAGRPGPSAVVDMAIVQLAVYDAVQSIEGDYEPYCGALPGASGDVRAAAARAARDVLLNRFTTPAQVSAISTAYHNYLIANPMPVNDPGFAVGAAAAQCMITMRANDGAFPSSFPANTGINQVGHWGYMANTQMAAPWLGFVTPFALRDPSQFRPNQDPPNLNSPEYVRAYSEVKSKGRIGSISTRTPDETEIANFWNMNFGAVMNRLARDLAVDNGLSVTESSRLLALADMSMADAIISSWDSKVHFQFWRPEIAIRFGADDGNPKTVGDPTWQPFIPTPPYSDYTSGANNIVNGAVRTLSLYFGEGTTFQIHTNNLVAVYPTRTYNSFSEALDEVEDARIFQGIHFRFADTAGRHQGKKVAQWAYSHQLRPANN